jgi:hypothetical protein
VSSDKIPAMASIEGTIQKHLEIISKPFEQAKYPGRQASSDEEESFTDYLGSA